MISKDLFQELRKLLPILKLETKTRLSLILLSFFQKLRLPTKNAQEAQEKDSKF
jgi:hypothetical protein